MLSPARAGMNEAEIDLVRRRDWTGMVDHGGGIGSSYAPSIGNAWDKGLQQDKLWKPVFDGYTPAREWLAEQKPDLFVIVYNDHMNRFFFDAYPTFAPGVGDVHAAEGWGKRNLPDLQSDPDIAGGVDPIVPGAVVWRPHLAPRESAPAIESGDSGRCKPPQLTDSKESEIFRTDTHHIWHCL